MASASRFLVLVLPLAFAVSASATVLFDAGGFESYTDGSIVGQNGWVTDSASPSFNIVSGAGVGGSKGLRASGTTTNWAWPTINYTPTATEYVRVQADISRTLSGSTPSFAYAIDIYNPTAARTFRFGLTASAGTIRPFVTSRFNTGTGQFDAASAISTVLVGAAVPADTFVSFDARLDYVLKRVDLFVNGVSVTGGFTIPFTDLTATGIGDADFQTSTNANATDSGVLDNYRVTAVPEPASMAVLGMGLAAFRRRRKA